MELAIWGGIIVVGVLLALVLSLRLELFYPTDFAFRALSSQSPDVRTRITKLIRPVFSEVKALRLLIVSLLSVGLLLLLGRLQPPLISAALLLVMLGVILVVARQSVAQVAATRCFEKAYSHVIQAAKILRPIWVITGLPTVQKVHLAESIEELIDQLHRLPNAVLSSQQRQRLETVLISEHKTVKDIMTRKKYVVTIEPSATLGPIVLADLQKSGHGYFPVMTKKGEPEGILALADIANIHEAKQRSKVRESMDLQIAYAEEDLSLEELANLFLQEKQYIVFVRSLDGAFSGVVTVADLMKHLVGITKE